MRSKLLKLVNVEFPCSVWKYLSFYNETKDKGIKPTPSIGGVGLIKDYNNMISIGLKNEGNTSS